MKHVEVVSYAANKAITEPAGEGVLLSHLDSPTARQIAAPISLAAICVEQLWPLLAVVDC